MTVRSPITRFADAVYSSTGPPSEITRFADLVYGRDDGESYRSPDENFEEFAEECRRLIRRSYDNVIVLDGFPGKGKSTLGIRLAQAIDPEFGIDSIAYTASEVLRLYRTKPPRSVILNDESALGLLSRSGHRDPELLALVQALSIVRIKQDTLICCVPDIRMLDSFVKFGRARFWINVYTRGRGKVHRCWRGARYKTSTSRLPYDEYVDVTPIGFHSLSRTRFWREYEEDKQARIFKWLEEHELDPEGRIKVCPDCGMRGSGYAIAIHRCPARQATAAPSRSGVDLPDGHVTSRVYATSPAPPAPRWRCGRFEFARHDGYVRHLSSRRHREECATSPGGAREQSLPP